jgi:hypothetical protein
VIYVINVTSSRDGHYHSGGANWLQWGHQSRDIRRNTGEAKMTQRTNKNANIEGKFFGMIVLAWALLAIVFNIAHSVLPQAKSPAAAKTAAAAAVTHATRVAAL